ncbi:hypothetical protein E2C01_045832 [Portunus trituberculatus]|uniref:Uncharacterized protein n=1 Tax=Portunus trituberculatus TaxID=210409 RepID=A0A5B7G419_PORTR|nr:hypothetical protein [Portunus trituberculatus]
MPTFLHEGREQRSSARPAPGSTAKHHDDRRLRHKPGWLNLIKQRLFVCAAGAASIKSRQKRVDAGKRVGTYAGENCRRENAMGQRTEI